MRRPVAHTLDDQAERLLEGAFPNEWITRRLPKDYGVDYEVEIVDSKVVTGKRLWVQLKGKATIKRHAELPWPAQRGPRVTTAVDHVRVSVPTKLLGYALACDFPLVLAVADIGTGAIFFVGLRDYITAVLDVITPKWRGQKTATVYIATSNTIKADLARPRDESLLRWYALDPGRRSALSQVALFVHELGYEVRLSGYSIGDGHMEGEEALFLASAQALRLYLERALQLDLLFGDDGPPLFRSVHRPGMEKALHLCAEAERDIAAGKISFGHTTGQLFELSQAETLLRNVIPSYHEHFRGRVIVPVSAAGLDAPQAA